eukprot:NODE_1697_length_1637_cov_132.636063_g1617_i0.p1 GENE.NODE_1697_length_1637_cov_132.636063_g1617_i0~~NODE_1697_length_1637_cov_132.636063_g1617_i0.p1  ORF type:complete len:485 (+),score=124.16 NODE_1697_length_1637_cov_132.636063_g1617_i0:56-1456(+)
MPAKKAASKKKGGPTKVKAPAKKAPKKQPRKKKESNKSSATESAVSSSNVQSDDQSYTLTNAIAQYEDLLAQMEAGGPRHAAPAPSSNAVRDLVSVFDEMVERFASRTFQTRYYAHPSELRAATLRAHEPVPMYFANVICSSVWYRKALSIAGLRNLVIYGHQIYTELQEQLFASDPSKYRNGAGLERMRYLTGNTVDLDTVVLRCNDPFYLKTINNMNKVKGLPQFRTTEEFGNSTQAQEIAVAAAEPLLNGFIEQFNLTPQDAKKRCVAPEVLSPKKGSKANAMGKSKGKGMGMGLFGEQWIPVACGNQDRGRWPVWRYCNVGVDTYHANVPNIADVIGALLKSPIAAAKAFLRCKDSPDMLDAFFEDGISDSCFNAKWKALEEFNDFLDSAGSIAKVLEEVQATHQNIFNPSLFDNDDADGSKEVAEMLKLIPGKKGRDKTGKTRCITKADVVAWVKDPSHAI